MALLPSQTVADAQSYDGAGASFDALENTNLATFTGVGLAAVTGGGALFVGAVVAPGQVLGGAAVAGTLCALGAVKAEHGSYFPFLQKGETKDAAPAATTDAAAPAAA